MEFIRNFSSKLGLDGIEVNVIINDNKIEVGSICNGILAIKGGSMKCRIGYITLLINTDYELRGKVDSKTVQKIMVPVDKDIYPREKLEVPFTFVPFNEMPISLGKSDVWISAEIEEKSKTKMLLPKSKVIYCGTDILDNNVVTHRLYLDVLPHKSMDKFFMVMENELGFKMIGIDKECLNSKDESKKVVLQKFIYEPRNYFKEKINTLNLIFNIQEEFIELIIEVDKKNKPLAEKFVGMFGVKGRRNVLRLEKDELDSIENIKNKIIYFIDSNVC